jgi:hypothetical protein
MRAAVLVCLAPLALMAQFHRAEQDREISYWLLEPATHQFRISHDFTITKAGQKYAHSFVRKGSMVSPETKIFNLDTGRELTSSIVSGKQVNALGYYPQPTDPESSVVQGELENPLSEGQSARIRVQETYTDPVGYALHDGELVWERTLGRPVNYVTLPTGWLLISVNTPAIISLDEESRVTLRLTNIRNDELSVIIRARRRNPGRPSQ